MHHATPSSQAHGDYPRRIGARPALALPSVAWDPKDVRDSLGGELPDGSFCRPVQPLASCERDKGLTVNNPMNDWQNEGRGSDLD
jgi:hypothetical protein